MTTLKNLILLLVIVLVPTFSFADEAPVPAPDAPAAFVPYYSLSAGGSLLNEDVKEAVRENYSNTKTLDAGVLYRFHPNFAVGVDYQSIRSLNGKYTGSLNEPNGYGEEQEYSCHESSSSLFSRAESRGFLLTLNGRYYPGEFYGTQPYLTVGGGLMRMNTVLKEITTTTESKGWGEYSYEETSTMTRRFPSHRETVFAGRYGAGVTIPLFKNAAVEFEASYTMPTQNLRDFDYVSASGRLVLNF